MKYRAGTRRKTAEYERADALRFLLLSSPVLSGEDFALLDKDVSDVNRKLAMIWNVYDFFTTYAELENWDSPLSPGNFGTGKIADLKNPLDRWILARLYETRRQVIDGMAEYDISKAYEDMIKSEVQASAIVLNENYAFDEIAKINGENITISLEKI